MIELQKEALRYALQVLAVLGGQFRESDDPVFVYYATLIRTVTKCVYLALDENPPENPRGLEEYAKWFADRKRRTPSDWLRPKP